MDKKEVIEKAVEVLEAKLKSFERLIGREEQKRKEAPSAMQSWSDNIRFEKEVLISGLTEEKERIKKHIRFLQSLSLGKKQKVEQGSLIEIKNIETGQISFYFISLFAGLELELEKNIKIMFLSPSSPLAKSLLNKKQGDKLKYGSNTAAQTLKIISIQ